MSLIHSNTLAGPNWKEPDSGTGIQSSRVYNTIGTFAIPSVHASFEGFKGPRNNKILIYDEKPGTKKRLIKTDLTYREPFHSFKYFEALGSTYGMHEIINERETMGEDPSPIVERWKSEPIYIERYSSMRPSVTLNYNNSDEDLCGFMEEITKSTEAKDNGFKVSFEELAKEIDGRKYIEFHIGEFHLLPNTPLAIHRCNLSADILTFRKGFAAFKGSDSLKSDVIQVPRISPTLNHFLEFYIGIARMKDSSVRPKEFNEKELNIRHPNNIEGGAQIRWKSLTESCMEWVRVYDGTDLKRLLSKDIYSSGHYVLNTRCRIDIEKLKAHLSTLDLAGESQLIIHPPSFNILGFDTLSLLKEPRYSRLITRLDKVEFDVQRNYKSNGGFHYRIMVYNEDKTVLLFSESTDADVGISILKDSGVSANRGTWRWSNLSGRDIGGLQIPFSNAYVNNAGINTELYGKITYTFNESVSEWLSRYRKIHITLETNDGTLLNG